MVKNKLKILIIDDDEPLLDLYSEIFSEAGYQVLQAHDGVEGLDIATKEIPDVIFTGIVMPRMDGFSMMEALKKTVMTSNIPVVISSHMGREEDRQKATMLGAKDFIVRNVTKPVEVIERIGALFVQEGGQYHIEFNPYALDAQKLAKELSLNQNFQCLECNEKLVLNLKLKNVKERMFESRFVCPNCGWQAK